MCLPGEAGKGRRARASRRPARRGCGAAEGPPGRSQRRGLAGLGREAGGRPSCERGGRGRSRGPRPAPFACLPPPLSVLLASRRRRKGRRRPLPRPGPRWTSGSCPALPRPRSSSLPHPPSPRCPPVWLRWRGLRSLALNQISRCHQDFPILCQTCLGENPYIRMVSEGV